MAIYELQSQKTGKTYKVDFDHQPSTDDVDHAINTFDSSAPSQADELSQKEQKFGLLGGTGEPMSREEAVNLSRRRFVDRAQMEGQPNIQMMNGQVKDVNQLSPLGEALLSVPRAFSAGQNFGATNLLEKGIEKAMLATGLTSPDVVKALGVKSQIEQENPLEVASGVAGGLATGLGAGSEIAAAPTLLKRIISGASTGAQGGALNAATNEIATDQGLNPTEIGKNAAIGGVLGGAIPAATEGIKATANAFKAPTIEDLGNEYRKILAPKKGDIKNVEIKSGKDINDSYQLAAKEGLIINKSADGKLDTTSAIDQLEAPKQEIEDQVSQSIASQPQKQFDVNDLRDEAKSRMRDLFKNDADYNDALKDVDREFDAIVKERGEKVDGSTLNEIKQGMWKKSYNQLSPTANNVARNVGNLLKTTIEDAYPEADIKELNSKIGDYVTLQQLLKNAHGNVVAKGKLGKYVVQGAGALAGHALGVSTGIPLVGEIAGVKLGGAINDYLTNPTRLTENLAKKASKLNLPQETNLRSTSQNIEQVAQNLAERAKMQRLADNIKNQELSNQIRASLPENMLASPQNANVESNIQSEPVLDQAIRDLINQKAQSQNASNLEESLKKLAAQSQMKRLSDIIKKEALRQNILNESAKNMNPSQRDELNQEFLKSLGLQ